MRPTDPLRQRIRTKLAEQRHLVRTLLGLREQLQGSLFARYGACGKDACACQRGALHGPYYVLSKTGAGRRSFSYLESDQVPEARLLVSRYRDFRAGVRRLKKINAEVVRLLKRYQQSTARRGGARLGLAS